MRPISKKRRRERKARRTLIDVVVDRDGVGCWGQRVWFHDCWGPLDAHELRSRAQYPGGHLDPDNVRLVCRACHEFIHDHPIAAFELGLLRSARLEAERG